MHSDDALVAWLKLMADLIGVMERQLDDLRSAQPAGGVTETKLELATMKLEDARRMLEHEAKVLG